MDARGIAFQSDAKGIQWLICDYGNLEWLTSQQFWAGILIKMTFLEPLPSPLKHTLSNLWAVPLSTSPLNWQADQLLFVIVVFRADPQGLHASSLHHTGCYEDTQFLSLAVSIKSLLTKSIFYHVEATLMTTSNKRFSRTLTCRISVTGFWAFETRSTKLYSLTTQQCPLGYFYGPTWFDLVACAD